MTKKPKPRPVVKGTITVEGIVTLLKGGRFVWMGEDSKNPCFELQIENIEKNKCEFSEDAASLLERNWED